MPHCVVKDCKSGYKTYSEKRHFFSVVKDGEQRKLWEAKIARSDIKLSDKHDVCDKHFLPEEVIKFKQLFGPDGAILGQSAPYQKPRLKPGSVPSQFLPSCNNEVEKSAVNTENGVDEVTGTFEEDHQDLQCLTLQELLQDDEIRMPISWRKHEAFNEQSQPVLCFTKTVVKQINGNDRCINLQELMVFPNLEYKVNVMGQKISPNVMGIKNNVIKDVVFLEDLLILLSSFDVCCGYDCDPKITSSVTYRDSANTLRHNDCDLLLTNKKRCTNCENVKRNHELKSKRLQDCNGVFKVRITSQLSEGDELKVQLLKKRIRSEKKSKEHFQHTTEDLRAELSRVREEIGKRDSAFVEQRITELHIDCHQQEAVKSIMQAAKVSGPNQMRYNENWILLCLLMHMNSPRGYRFLKDNHILPVPDVRTIRRYLSRMQVKCGFDESFFEMLQASFESKPENQRHGIVLLDEMSTRTNISVMSKTLSYNGLIDFGDKQLNEDCINQANLFRKSGTSKKKNNTNHEEQGKSPFDAQADHCLVFIFQPLYDSYAQPIAVFASKGPVPGAVLAQLLVQAIRLLENCGAKVHEVVSDGAVCNRKFWSLLGISGELGREKCSFEHPVDEDRRIFVLSDAPHLIKTIRNKIFNDGAIQMKPGGKLVEWAHFVNLYEEDNSGMGKIRIYPKISINHVVLNSSSKMRVRLATQIFSKTVASALRFYSKYVPKLQDVEETASFCEWVNNFFDFLNISDTKTGLSVDSTHFKVLQDALATLNEWEKHVKQGLIARQLFLTKPTAEGLRVTFLSVMEMTTYLSSKYGFNKMFTVRLNQDALEVRKRSTLFQKLNKETVFHITLLNNCVQ